LLLLVLFRSVHVICPNCVFVYSCIRGGFVTHFALFGLHPSKLNSTESETQEVPQILLCYFTIKQGTAVAQWLSCCATNRKVAGSIPASVIGIFHSIRSHYGPGVDSAPNRNEYQEHFLGVKAAGA
jgi:hypothetical protein